MVDYIEAKKHKCENKRLLYLMEGIKMETPIYQYMKLEYLISLLETKSYFIRAKKHFEDKRESNILSKKMFKMHYVHENIEPTQLKRELEEMSSKLSEYGKTGTWLTSCWTLKEDEDILMWKSYASEMGVRIKSSIQNFATSLDTDNYWLWCGKMSYNGYNHNMSFEECLFSKEPYYSSEKEFRFYFMPFDNQKNEQEQVSIPIMPNIMIGEIVISPFFNKDFSDWIMKEIKQIPIKRSEIKL